MDRAIWTFAKTIESEQEQAVSRLPKTAKDAAHSRSKQRILDLYLGVKLAEEPKRFRAPG